MKEISAKIDDVIKKAIKIRPNLRSQLTNPDLRILLIAACENEEIATELIENHIDSVSLGFNAQQLKVGLKTIGSGTLIALAISLALNIQSRENSDTNIFSDFLKNVHIYYYGHSNGSQTPTSPTLPNPSLYTVSGFGLGKSSIPFQEEPKLKRLGSLLEQYPDLKIQLQGHTDRNQGQEHKPLSTKRAQEVMDYLVSLGIDSSRITVIGLGHTNPILFEDGSENEPMSRRVEVFWQ